MPKGWSLEEVDEGSGEVTERDIMPWNHAYPHWSLSTAKGVDVDDPFAEPGSDEGDPLMAEMQRLRAAMVPRTLWSNAEVRYFAAAWEDWKRQHGLIDFTEMLELALQEVPYAPGNPAVGFVDEAQDMTPLQMALIHSWARFMTHLVTLGDDDQILYSWAGCRPETMTDPAPDHINILSQSWRVPRKVHTLANRWIAQVAHRQPKEYLPRDAEGEAKRSPATWREPQALVQDAQERMANGQSVMFLATCGYMLQPLLDELKEQGVPFHNPYRCSPPDEPVLTTDGYVKIGELDPTYHKLAGFYPNTNALSWGGTSGPRRDWQERGFTFSIGHKPYSGDLLTIKTSKTRTRVTPNHRVRVRYNDAFYGKWIVYLMRRGNHWRVGMTSSGSKPFMSDGIGGRVSYEDADGAWIISMHDSKQEAMFTEATVQARYGLTGMTFIAWPSVRRHFTQAPLDRFHRELAPYSGDAARRLLRDRGLLEDHPLFIGDGRRRRRTGVAFETVAANLLPGYMDMPVAPDCFVQSTNCSRIAPEWLPLSVSREYYEGPVYSMDVPGPEHYVSGGAIVHNSKAPNWNPFHTSSGTTATDKLLMFLRNNDNIYGEDARLWTYRELATWIEPIEAKGVLLHGAKTKIKEMKAEPGIAGFDKLAEWFTEDALNALFDCDPEWYSAHTLDRVSKSLAFPMRVLRKMGPVGLQGKPQCIVGTVHSVKGGEADCSPYDEPVLTTNRGYVPIGELDPEMDRLVSFNADHHKIHRGGPRRPNGYAFQKAVRPYDGSLLTIETARSRTRVTPNHHLTVRWSPAAKGKHVVYLMRRGNWWRIGTTQLLQQNNQAGVLMRMRREQADAGWILGVFDTQSDALYHEMLWSHTYGVPDLCFEQVARNGNQLDSAHLHMIWNQINSAGGAINLLHSRGLDPAWPMWDMTGKEGRRIRQAGFRNRWTVRAANLLPGCMEIPTDPGSGQEPEWLPFTISEEWYTGDVYSLDVERWHHYVSGGAVVHNCVYVFPDLSNAAYFDNWMGNDQDSIIRLFYVALTRAREAVVICSPTSYLTVEGIA